MYAELSGNRVWLTSEFREKDLVKQIPGSRWSPEFRQWWVPLSWAACVNMRGIFGADLQVGPELAEWARKEVSERIDPCIALRDAEDAELPDILGHLPKAGDILNGEPVEFDWDLEPRQRAGVKFLATAQRAAMCDGMGSGKTIQMIVALELLAFEGKDPYPVLVVCPNSMKETWVKEFALWAPHRDVAAVTGGAAKRKKIIRDGHEVLVINWEGLKGHSKCAGYGAMKLSEKEAEKKDLNEIGLRTIVCDEAHRGKSPKAQQTRAAWAVARECTFRFALTGTPLANTPEDTWSIMHMLAPEEWPSKTKFIDRFALQSWSNFGFMNVVGLKGETRDEFFKILDPRFIRRPTRVVVPDLLEKLPPQIRWVELGPKQRKAYNQLREDLLAELDEGVLMATNPLTRMVRLVQLSAAYGEFDDHEKFLLAEPSTKLDALDELVEELGDEQAVIFAESRQLIELAAGRFEKADRSFGLITGGISTADRQMYVEEFQRGNLGFILATLGAGGEGLTLTAARHSIFLQRSFSLVKNLQAEDRIWRKGQMRSVQRIDIIAADTIEEHVLDVGAEKEGRLEEVCRDEDTLRKWLER